MPRPKQRTPELRDRVLHVAVDLIADGLGGFTTRRVADLAGTSVPAVYELFGDKSGLVRAVFFEGFRQLQEHIDLLHRTDDPRADLGRLAGAFRAFVRARPVLAGIMFSRPLSDFDADPDEWRAAAAVRSSFVDHVRRCIEAGVVQGDETDIAHVLLALAQGMAAQETAGWLGTSAASRNRRWALAIDAAIDGLAPAPAPATRRGRR